MTRTSIDTHSGQSALVLPSETTASRPASPDSQWMTMQQAAVYIATSVKTVRRMIARRDLPAYHCGKRGLRVRRDDLDNLMKPI